MEIEALLLQSLQLLGLGMGAVFTILALMIVIITVVSKIVPEEVIDLRKRNRRYDETLARAR